MGYSLCMTTDERKLFSSKNGLMSLWNRFLSYPPFMGLFPGGRPFLCMHYLYHYSWVPIRILSRYVQHMGYSKSDVRSYWHRPLIHNGLVETEKLEIEGYLEAPRMRRRQYHFNLTKLGLEYYSFSCLFVDYILHFSEEMSVFLDSALHQQRVVKPAPDKKRIDFLQKNHVTTSVLFDTIPPKPPPPTVVAAWTDEEVARQHPDWFPVLTGGDAVAHALKRADMRDHYSNLAKQTQRSGLVSSQHVSDETG